MSEVGSEYVGAANKVSRASGSGDRLEGVDAIANYLRCTVDAVYYARRVGSLPIRRLGCKGALYAFRSELDAAQKADSTLPAKWSGDCIGAS